MHEPDYAEWGMRPALGAVDDQGVDDALLDDHDFGVAEASVRALLERLPGTGAFIIDRDYKVLLCGGGAFAAADWDPAAIEGSRLPDILDPARWPVLGRHYDAALDGEAQSFTLPQPSGRVHQVIASPISGPDGRVDGLFVVTVDSTTQSSAERRIREAQMLLRAAFDAAPTALIVFSPETHDFGRVLQANGATARMFGYSLDTLPDKRLRDLFPPGQGEWVDRLPALATEAGEPAAVDQPLVDARGRQLWGRLHVSFVHDDAGAATLGVVQIEDVTKERRREEALRFSQHRLGLVFQNAPVGMVIADLQPGNEGILLNLNEAFAQLVGRPIDELPGTHFSALTHPDDVDVSVGSLMPLARGEVETFTVDKRYLRPDGSVRIARMRFSAIQEDTGSARYALGVAIDMTERLTAEAAREGILESVFEAVIATDSAGRITAFNRAAEEMLGYRRDDVFGRPCFDLFVPPEFRDRFDAAKARMWVAERDTVVAERQLATLLRADGARLTVEVSARRTGVEPAEFTAFIRDVTAERRAERERQGTEDLFRTMFENSAVGMAVLSLEGRCMEANLELCRFLGRTLDELRECTVKDVSHPDDHVPNTELMKALEEHGALHREKRFLRGDGQVVWGHVHTTLLHDEHGRPRGVQSQIVDITEHHHTDARLGAVLESLAEGVIAIDERGRIELINAAALDLLGYREKDIVGRPMHETIHPHSGPARCCPIAAVAGTGEAVRVEDDTFLRADGSGLPVSYSAAPLGTGDERGVVVVFSDISERKARDQVLRRRLASLDRLEQTRVALQDDRLVLYSQPILDVTSGEIVQEELLLRMLGEDGEIIPPGDFLPVAEEYGLIADIDRWVIGRGAEIAAQGRHVEVNVSGRTLGHRDLAGWVEDALHASGADPKLMTFEITETALTADLEQACRFAERVADLGCGFALDDFGTGYGSFMLLKRLPISYLKIDIEFVRSLLQEEADRHVVQAVVSLARGLGMRTIAEGVEDQATLDALRKMGVDLAQGYLIGRPAPVE